MAWKHFQSLQRAFLRITGIKQKLSNKAILWWAFIGAVVVTAVYIGVVVILLKQPIDSEHLRNIILIFVGIMGLAIAIQRAQAADKQADAALEQAKSQLEQAKSQSHQVKNVSKQITISEQGQITERFTRAIEQLSSDKLFLRLGAISALERIGRDKKENIDDVLAVLQLLSGFVREESPAKDNIASMAKSIPQDIQESVFAILSLAKQYKQFIEEKKYCIDLSHTQLSLIRLPDRPYLGYFNFSGSNLSSVHFTYSDCNNASFRYANLTHTVFHIGKLDDAWFEQTDLSRATFLSTSLLRASFESATLDDAEFDDVDMDGAYLDWAHCNSTSFPNAKNMTTRMLARIRFFERTPPEKIPAGVRLPQPTD